MIRGKKYKLGKDLNNKYLKKCTLIRYFQESKNKNISKNTKTHYNPKKINKVFHTWSS